MKLEIRRPKNGFLEDRTLGQLWVDGALFCHTLEDTARAEGVKVPGHTCVPPCIAKVKVDMSARFGRLMPMIYTEDNEYQIKAGGIEFKGIRFHGGNTPEDTEGCVLVAFNRAGNRIHGSAEGNLTELVQNALLNGEEVTCEWINNDERP